MSQETIVEEVPSPDDRPAPRLGRAGMDRLRRGLLVLRTRGMTGPTPAGGSDPAGTRCSPKRRCRAPAEPPGHTRHSPAGTAASPSSPHLTAHGISGDRLDTHLQLGRKHSLDEDSFTALMTLLAGYIGYPRASQAMETVHALFAATR